MAAAAIPESERQRLEALWALELLDTAPERGFDAITAMAADLCDTPIALVTLVDEHRQWFKSNRGFESCASTSRDVAFCSHAILEGGMFEVADATEDVRFADNPLVRYDPNIRFYAGVPLLAGDQRMPVGTLCVLDVVPRTLTQQQRERLHTLADAVAGLMVRPRWTGAAQQESALFGSVLLRSEQADARSDALVEYGVALASAGDVGVILATAVSTAMRLVRADAACSIVRARDKTWVTANVEHLPELAGGRRVPYDEIALVSHQQQLVRSFTKMGSVEGTTLFAELARAKMRSFAVARIGRVDAPRAYLVVASKRNSAFSTADERALALVATHANLALASRIA